MISRGHFGSPGFGARPLPNIRPASEGRSTFRNAAQTASVGGRLVLDDTGFYPEDMPKNETTGLCLVLSLRPILLLGAIERVVIDRLQLGNNVKRELWEDLLEREGQAMSVGEHVGRQVSNSYSAGFKRRPIRIFRRHPISSETGFHNRSGKNGVFELYDGEAFCLDGLEYAGIAEQAIRIRHGGDPRHIWHEAPDNLFTPFRHR